MAVVVFFLANLSQGKAQDEYGGWRRSPATVTMIKVTHVFKGSRADDAGLCAGDVIWTIDGKRVPNGRAYDAAMRRAARSGCATLTILRRGEELEVEVDVSRSGKIGILYDVAVKRVGYGAEDTEPIDDPDAR